MVDSNKLRPGTKIIFEDVPYQVVDMSLRQQPRSVAKVVTKLQNMLTGNMLEKTFTSGEDLQLADISLVSAQYLYEAAGSYYFMNNDSYEQLELDAAMVGRAVDYLTEGQELYLQLWNDAVIGLQLPPSVVLKVVETEPGLRGDTASGGTKPAKMQTGLVVKVPFFISTDEELVINTETGEYRERAK